jgi:hypothetical protein
MFFLTQYMLLSQVMIKQAASLMLTPWWMW